MDVCLVTMIARSPSNYSIISTLTAGIFDSLHMDSLLNCIRDNLDSGYEFVITLELINQPRNRDRTMARFDQYGHKTFCDPSWDEIADIKSIDREASE